MPSSSSRKKKKEKAASKATVLEPIVYVTVPPNPEETVEVMKLVSQERVQQWTVEQFMDVLVTMRVETGHSQYAHTVMDVPVVGVPVHGSKRQLHRRVAVKRGRKQERRQGRNEESVKSDRRGLRTIQISSSRSMVPRCCVTERRETDSKQRL